MKYKLIATDMDGTLVNDKSELTERTRDAIVKAVDAGVLFVTATGRPFSNVQIVNDLLDKDMPFIVFNGAAAYMGKSGKLLFERFLDFELAKEAFDKGQELGISQIVWTGPRLWANRRDEATEKYEALCKDLKMTIITDLAAIKDEAGGRTQGDGSLVLGGISKVLWIDDPANVKKLSVKMCAQFGNRLKCVSSMAHFLEFVSIDAGKGTALAEIGKLFGIDRSEMIAVGDGYNDVCMLEYAGLGVAVKNAPEDIKAKCNHITSSNNNNGVAEVIEKYILV